MRVLVTGGAGYIGSHTVIALIEAGHEPLIVDNFCNAKESVIARLEKITGRNIPYVKLDLLEEKNVSRLFQKHSFDAVIHFAALKAVGESVKQPLKYYENNTMSLVNILKGVVEHKVQKFIFSSSATVYGAPEKVPITEDEPIKATNPYGQTKVFGEQIIKDVFLNSGTAVLLRYFNPIGAHPSGMIGEDPNGVPNNLVPYITKVAAGELEKLSVFGDDYDTRDGTGVRDYIHVMDLAEGHVAALLKDEKGVFAYNLGTGTGYSVLEIVEMFRKVSKKPIQVTATERRPGDIGVCYADCSLAEKEIGWKAKRTLEEMCQDSWRWQLSASKLID